MECGKKAQVRCAVTSHSKPDPAANSGPWGDVIKAPRQLRTRSGVARPRQSATRDQGMFEYNPVFNTPINSATGPARFATSAMSSPEPEVDAQEDAGEQQFPASVLQTAYSTDQNVQNMVGGATAKVCCCNLVCCVVLPQWDFAGEVLHLRSHPDSSRSLHEFMHAHAQSTVLHKPVISDDNPAECHL